ncbi:MAG: acyl carrier protein [Anaerolineales bacterium]
MNTHDIIRDFITSEMLPRPLDAPIGDDDPLIESGIIDSMGVMNLLGFLEEKFSIQIPGEELIPENFSTINAIAALIERQCIPVAR